MIEQVKIEDNGTYWDITFPNKVFVAGSWGDAWWIHKYTFPDRISVILWAMKVLREQGE